MKIFLGILYFLPANGSAESYLVYLFKIVFEEKLLWFIALFGSWWEPSIGLYGAGEIGK